MSLPFMRKQKTLIELCSWEDKEDRDIDNSLAIVKISDDEYILLKVGG
jgi:hypothetical protein